MTPRVLSAVDSRHLDDRIALSASAPGSVALGPVLDERGHVGIERASVPWALLRALPTPALDEVMRLLEHVAAQPHVEVYEQHDPEALGIIRRGRPRPAITRVTNPAARSAFVDDRGYDRFMRDSAYLFGFGVWPQRGGKSSLFPGGGTVL